MENTGFQTIPPNTDGAVGIYKTKPGGYVIGFIVTVDGKMVWSSVTLEIDQALGAREFSVFVTQLLADRFKVPLEQIALVAVSQIAYETIDA